MKFIHCLWATLIFSSLGLNGSAHNGDTHARILEQSPTDSVVTSFHFRVGQSNVDPSYYKNALALETVKSSIKNFSDEGREVSVNIIGLTSPEGNASTNTGIAWRRAENSRHFILSNLSGNIDPKISIRNGGINWSGLRTVLKAAHKFPGRDETLNILDNISSDGKLPYNDIERIKQLYGGRIWERLNDDYFPELRSALITIYSQPQAAESSDRATAHEVQSDTVDINSLTVENANVDTVLIAETEILVTEEKTVRPFYMSVSTNMLYDAILLPNIGMEFYLGKNWSISGNWMYGWWNNNHHHKYWRAYGGDLELRKWLGSASKRKPLTGHHLGIYAQILLYDFEFGGKGQMSGKPGANIWEKASYAAGLEYGFALPVARRLNIDFTVGIGYLSGDYYEYIPEDNHYVWLNTKKRSWFGPTKAQISLVWLLGHGNTNKKGGKR